MPATSAQSFIFYIFIASCSTMKFCFGFSLSQIQATYTKLFPTTIEHTMNSFADIRSTIPRQSTQNIRLERLWKTNGTARSRRHR